MTPDLLSAIAAIILSLCASYLPGFSPWYDALTTIYKRLVMGALLLAVSVASAVIACAGYAQQFGLGLACDQNSFVILVRSFISALVANQSAYLLTRKNDNSQENPR